MLGNIDRWHNNFLEANEKSSAVFVWSKTKDDQFYYHKSKKKKEIFQNEEAGSIEKWLKLLIDYQKLLAD